MHSDTSRSHALAPLILRVTLGAVFIFHGFAKISGPGNELGAAWASRLWSGQDAPPADVLAKMDRMSGESAERVAELKEKLRASYSLQSAELPGSLQHHVVQLLVAWGELIGGIALLVGLLTRLSAAAMIAIQVGAIATVTWARGFSFGEGGGYEFNLALLAMCAALLVTGGGYCSVDRCLVARRQPHGAGHA
jgi:uncharacterized membrane protein YphA (DoxX/SURF4 family)